MKIPSDKPLIRVEYTYADGSKYELVGEEVGKFTENLAATIVMALHGHKFNELNWNEVKNNASNERP